MDAVLLEHQSSVVVLASKPVSCHRQPLLSLQTRQRLGLTDPKSSRQRTGREPVHHHGSAYAFLVVGVAAPGLTAAPPLVAESGLETAVSVETVDDVMGGRNAARAFGEVATRLGFDGEQPTMELIRGETTRSHAFTAVIGFLQNLGINVTANNVLRAFNSGQRAPLPNEERAAEALGMSSDEVAAAVDDVQQTAYRPDEEPTESLQLDDGVSVPDSFKPESFNEALDDAIALDGDPAMVSARDRQNVSAAWEEIKRTWLDVPQGDREHRRRIKEPVRTLLVPGKRQSSSTMEVWLPLLTHKSGLPIDWKHHCLAESTRQQWLLRFCEMLLPLNGSTVSTGYSNIVPSLTAKTFSVSSTKRRSVLNACSCFC